MRQDLCQRKGSSWYWTHRYSDAHRKTAFDVPQTWDSCRGSCDLWLRGGFGLQCGKQLPKCFDSPETDRGGKGGEHLNLPPLSYAHSTAGNIHPRWADRTGDWSILPDVGWQEDLRWVCVPLRLVRFVWRGQVKECKQDHDAYVAWWGRERKREREFSKESRAPNRDKDLNTHGPHVWQLNRQHDWLHERGIISTPLLGKSA